MPPEHHQTGNPGNQARFQQPQPDALFHHSTGQEFDHLKRIEPLKIPDLWFAGNAYADLYGIPFCLPQFQLVEALLGGLIAIFGDKFSKENAKQALLACKQRNLTIGEYNAQFSSLVYLIEDVPENHIEKYVSGLNPHIIRKAMSKQWQDANTLCKRMDLAAKAAAQLNLLVLLPPEQGQNHPHTPLSTNCPPGFPNHFSIPLPPQRDLDAMEVDALRYQPGSRQARTRAASIGSMP
ncbi:hypothetical protein PCASD_17039 [Puccinia coronata f. sp. avenae]|uniref:Retrotransposon gag domain-containing protein n=1 Tax=Puccinia coronata f. sp. avenae TaxID=200324 RepID=A0A2N5T9E0_9BASI|nr:hypothetical protein PCASD_17730 [Puccinia coronata f. sp. avenae]PLW31637.1 hypothetical protein PCASD_17039 [Puccinia coronata f. sp. avenae]